MVSAILVSHGRLDLEDARFVSEETFHKWMPVPVSKGDVLLTSEAPLGRVALVPSDAPLVLGQRLFALRGKSGILDSRYLFYALQTDKVRADLVGRSTGTTVFGIRQSALRNVRIPAPEYTQQRAIAEVLGALDDKIAANTKLAEKLAELASMHFVAASRACHSAAQPLAGIVATQYGLTTSAHDGAGPRLLRVTDINKKPWIDWDHVPACTVGESDLKKYRVRPGDVLVARMADPGKAAFIDDGAPDAVFASYLVRLQPINPSHAMYIYYFLRSGRYRRYAEGAMTGSVQKNMNAKVIVGTEIAIPDSVVLGEFNRTVGTLRASLSSVLTENRVLSVTRDVLLSQLMSGKICVKDAEKTVEEVL